MYEDCDAPMQAGIGRERERVNLFWSAYSGRACTARAQLLASANEPYMMGLPDCDENNLQHHSVLEMDEVWKRT